MTVEQNVKGLLGELTLQICSLQAQLEEANQKIKDLESKDNEK